MNPSASRNENEYLTIEVIYFVLRVVYDPNEWNILFYIIPTISFRRRQSSEFVDSKEIIHLSGLAYV